MAGEISLDVVHEINQASADQKDKWIEKLDEKFKKMKSTLKKKQPEKKKQPKKTENTNIYKIPANMRNNFDDFYAPCRVSFGPYYHGQASCESTEDIKERVVIHSLHMSNKTIHDYEKALRGVLRNLKDKYDDLAMNWQQDDEAFLQLMIYDGCFLLEVLRTANDDTSDSPVWDVNGVSRNKLMEDYRNDMPLLENQLPMLVLEKLFHVQNNISESNLFLDMLHESFNREKKLDPQENLFRNIFMFVLPMVNVEIPTRKCLHVLDLYRHSLLTQELRRKSKVRYCLRRIMDPFAIFTSGIPAFILLSLLGPVVYVFLALVDITLFLLKCIIPFPLKLLTFILKTRTATEFHLDSRSATELNEVGIGFTGTTKSLRDISYGRRTLRLPQILVDGTTKSIFLNLIAFEQLHKDAENEVTSYVYFMSSLIKDRDDVRHLKRCGVIQSRVRTEVEIVQLFESLTRDINVHDPDSFIVPRYRDTSVRLKDAFHNMNKPWRKDLWQTYLRSPWAFVSILAAFLLFVLTTVQTAYTVLGYYNSK